MRFRIFGNNKHVSCAEEGETNVVVRVYDLAGKSVYGLPRGLVTLKNQGESPRSSPLMLSERPKVTGIPSSAKRRASSRNLAVRLSCREGLFSAGARVYSLVSSAGYQLAAIGKALGAGRKTLNEE